MIWTWNLLNAFQKFVDLIHGFNQSITKAAVQNDWTRKLLTPLKLEWKQRNGKCPCLL